jgi:phosphoribosylanthranilate isomerase
MTRVKICGITNLADARVAVDAGADAFGLIFAESPRRVTPDAALELLRALGPVPCVPVGVFVDESVDRIAEIADVVGLRCFQLHGEERPGAVTKLRELGYDVVKSFRVKAGVDLDWLGWYQPTAFLLDTFVAGKAGGTGRAFDWFLARTVAKLGRVIVSGGLGIDNVLDAIRVGSPYGVDASSRLELKPGVKDPALVREFVRLVKSAAPAAVPATLWPR